MEKKIKLKTYLVWYDFAEYFSAEIEATSEKEAKEKYKKGEYKNKKGRKRKRIDFTRQPWKEKK